MMLGQPAAKRKSEQRTSEHARKCNPSDDHRAHNVVSLLQHFASANPTEGRKHLDTGTRSGGEDKVSLSMGQSRDERALDYRRAPATTMSTLRLPHCEHTTRSRRSGTVVFGAVALCHFGRAKLDLMAAIPAPQNWPHMGRCGVTQRHLRAWFGLHPRRRLFAAVARGGAYVFSGGKGLPDRRRIKLVEDGL